MEFTTEMIEKAKTAANAAELLKLAEAEGLAMTMEQAEQYFAQLNPVKGELGDDELDDVAGGGCKTSKGQTVVTANLKCFTGGYSSNIKSYVPKMVGSEKEWYNTSNLGLRKIWYQACDGGRRCGSCRFLEFKAGTGYCSKS